MYKSLFSLVKLQRRIYTANQALQLFMMTEWTFENDQFRQLHSEIQPNDLKDFRFDVFFTIDVREYIQNCLLGARRYLLNESDENLPKAKKNYIRLWYIDAVVKYAVYMIIGYFLMVKFGIL